MIWFDIVRSANHPLTLWPWGKDMSAARVQYKCSPRDFESENSVKNRIIFIFKKWNYLDYDQSDISGSMFAKLLQIVSEMCKFCVAIWCGVIYCQGPLSDALSLCYPQPLLNIYQTDPICCPSLESWLSRMKFAQTLEEMLLTIGNSQETLSGADIGKQTQGDPQSYWLCFRSS